MRSTIVPVLVLLLLSGCASEPSDEQSVTRFSDALSATYHTTITTLITLASEAGERAEVRIATNATRSYDEGRMLVLETTTRRIGNATRIDERGWYRDRNRALISENGTWSDYAPMTSYDDDLLVLREPLIVLEEHLDQGYVSDEPFGSSATYALEEAHRLFNASIGEGTPEIEILEATITFENERPSSTRIEALVTSQDGSSRARVLMERAYVDIGTTRVNEPERPQQQLHGSGSAGS